MPVLDPIGSQWPHRITLSRRSVFGVDGCADTAPGKNQDAHLLSDGFAAVVDGGRPGDRGNARRVRFATDVAGELHRARHLPGSAMLAHAGQALREAGLSETGLEAASLATARAEAHRLVVQVLRDSVAVVELRDGTREVIRDHHRDGGQALLEAGAAGQVEPHAPERSRESMTLARRWIASRGNRESGWWMVSSEPGAAALGVERIFDLSQVEAVLLSTDGLVSQAVALGIGAGDLEVFALTRHLGVPAVLAEVRRREAHDPRCLTWARTASTDDATAILLTREHRRAAPDAIPRAR